MRKLHFWFLPLLFCVMIFTASSVADDSPGVRFATFNIAMGLESEGELYRRLISADDEALQKVAAIIQQVRPDVLLLNEFDSYEIDSTLLFIKNYLETPQFGNTAISYDHSLNGAVNTGYDSGLDLNNNGVLEEAEDAWGYGKFPGQYGMVVLSRFPLKLDRSFKFFKWTDMPDALVPVNPDGSTWYPENIYEKLRLSSKNHWDVAITIEDRQIHFLVSHPTPPVFDGPEDRNGKRNHDEIRLWADYIDPEKSGYIYDDKNNAGGLAEGAQFVIAGDLNADPVDGDSSGKAILQLLKHPGINVDCLPISNGSVEATTTQAGKNLQQLGNPASDTGDFNDKYTGNMRIDYVLPSATLKVTTCGVFWPATDEAGHDLINVSDHRLVWVDMNLGG